MTTDSLEQQLISVGRVTKQRGTAGEVEIRFTQPEVMDDGTAEYLMLRLDGLLVPYFWEEFRFKNQDTAIVAFDDVLSRTDSEPLIGAEVLYPLDALPPDDGETLSSLRALRGFSVYAPQLLGTITDVDDTTPNTVLYVRRTDTGTPLLLPYHDDFLRSFSIRDKQIHLQFPFDVEELA